MINDDAHMQTLKEKCKLGKKGVDVTVEKGKDKLLVGQFSPDAPFELDIFPVVN